MSQTDVWNQFDYFPSSVYILEKEEFLKAVNKVSKEYLSKAKEDVNDIYPVKMTEPYQHEESIKDFTDYVLNTSWNVLKSQGYAMDNFRTICTSMWTQEHHKYSAMEQHVHGDGTQITGFYFLDCQDDGSKVVFHDPRPGKVMIGLPDEDMSKATPASNMINFTPKPGMLILTNSYLPHSFTRNASDKIERFVHINIAVIPSQQSCPAPAEVI